jgi:hypothetical protein
MLRSLVIASLLAAPALADSATPPGSIYRFDIAISGMESDPKAAPATYTLTLEENRGGKFGTGANISISSNMRQNVGLDFEGKFSLRGTTVVFDGDMQLTSIEPTTTNGATTLHRVHAANVVPISGTAPTLFASVYDTVSHRRYEVNITAKKLL